ncbi:MAG: hypothetical protein QXG44_11375, partial [Candidatus Jordarchaeaceae archaeon]
MIKNTYTPRTPTKHTPNGKDSTPAQLKNPSQQATQTSHKTPPQQVPTTPKNSWKEKTKLPVGLYYNFKGVFSPGDKSERLTRL